MAENECISCPEGMPLHECPESKRPCGHHCNCSWVHDVCHWCGSEFGEADDLEVAFDAPAAEPTRVPAEALR